MEPSVKPRPQTERTSARVHPVTEVWTVRMTSTSVMKVKIVTGKIVFDVTMSIFCCFLLVFEICENGGTCVNTPGSFRFVILYVVHL